MHDMTRRKLLLGAGAGAVVLATGLGMRAALAAGKIRPSDQDALLVRSIGHGRHPGFAIISQRMAITELKPGMPNRNQRRNSAW